MSAISIRKEIAIKYIRYILPYIFYDQDIIVYSLALRYGRTLLHEPYNLTFYRIHGKNTSKVYGNDIKKAVRVRALELLSYNLIIKILNFNDDLKNIAKGIINRMTGTTSYDNLLTIMTGLKYYIIRQSLTTLLSSIKNISMNRAVISLLGVAYLMSPYIGRRLIYRRQFLNNIK